MLSGILWASTFLAELVHLLKGSTREAHELKFPSLRFPHSEMASSTFRTTLGDNGFRPDPIGRRNLAVPTILIPRKFSSDESLTYRAQTVPDVSLPWVRHVVVPGRQALADEMCYFVRGSERTATCYARCRAHMTGRPNVHN